MKFMLSLLALGYVALATSAPSLPVHPGGIGGLFKGPNSETIIKGPDGSVITAAAEGGEISSNLEPIVVAEPEVVQEVAPVPIVEAVAVPAPVVESEQASDLIGPSGRISTHGSSSVVAGPASTTVTGPAVVAETIVKGPPLVGTTLVADHVALPVSVTPTPILGGTPVVSPIAVTASPVSIVTPFPVVTSTALRGSLAPSVGVEVTPQAVAAVSTSLHHSVASAAATNGGSATAAVAPHGASASAEIDGVSVVTPSPLPAVSSTVLPSLVIQDGVGHGLAGINDRIDLRGVVVPDQLAVDNVGLSIPSLNLLPPEIAVTPRTPVARVSTVVPIQPVNVYPNGVNVHSGVPIGNVQPGVVGPVLEVTPSPVIPVTGKIPISELRPTSGVIAPSINVVPPEAVTPTISVDDVRPGNVVPIPEVTPTPIIPTNEIRPSPGSPILASGLAPSVNVIPPGTSITPRIPVGGRRLIPETILTTPGLGTVANSNNIQREEDISTNIPQTPQIISQGSLTSQDLGLQSPQTLLNSQIQYAGSADLSKTNQAQANGAPLFRPTSGSVISLTNVQQQNLLANELAKSGIDPSQLQLTNVPLSSVSSIPGRLSNNLGLKIEGTNDGLAWGRYGREVMSEEKKQEKTQEKKEEKRE